MTGARVIPPALVAAVYLRDARSIDAIHRVLRRNDIITPKKPRRKHTHPSRPLTSMDSPNTTWTTDFK
jgi:hypothetical protein